MNARAGLILCSLLLAPGVAGCNAFADAVDGGDHGVDGLDQLVFDPNSPVLQQGQRRDFVISFASDPPWVGLDGGEPYLTKFKFYDSNDQNVELEDIYPIPDVRPPKSVSATLQASRDADTTKIRLLIIEMAFDQSGKPQLLHAGGGLFWVLPRSDAQTGDGEDGGAGDGADGGQLGDGGAG